VSYVIQLLPTSAVKHFSGEVTFGDIINSEREISGSVNFSSLRYVISDYSDAHFVTLTELERQEIRAMRIGGFYTNPRIKYAFVTTDAKVRAAIEESVAVGDTLHPTRVFASFEEAMLWVSL
jgi:hypothetical protein